MLDVLAVDLDPQADLSQALMHGSYSNFLKERRPSIVEIFNGYRPPGEATAAPVQPSPLDGVETIGQIDGRSLQLIPSRFDFSDELVAAIRPDPRVLARFLAANFSAKNLIILDCPPTESIFTIAAYHSSRFVLVPVKPEYSATIGFPLLQESLASFRSANRRHQLEVCGVVVNNVLHPGDNHGGREKAQALVEIKAESAKNRWPMYQREIPHSSGFPKIMRGDNAYSGNARMFRFFAAEFFRSLGL
jgi:chromosome partitioning protein